MAAIGRTHFSIIAAGYAGGVAAFPWLPGPYLALEGPLVVRAAIAFLIPTAALVSCAAVETLYRRTTSDAPHVESAKAVRAVMAFTALFMVALHGLVLLSLLGLPHSRFPAHRVAVGLFGLVLIGVGNILPRIRPNIVIGIHAPLLLANRTAWALVHRVAGHVLAALGAIAIGAGLMLSKSQIPIVLSAAVVVGAALNLAAYWRETRG